MNVRQLLDLSGRAAIITGGSTGLGRQMAEALAEMGANLVLCARKRERCEQAAEELRQSGVETLPLACDVGNPRDVQAMVAAAHDRFGRIDILVNNAGTAWGAPVEEMQLEHWNKVITTNLTGTFLCSQAVGKLMIHEHHGKIINLASVAGLVGGASAMQAVGYSASKGGVISFTRDLACKWAPHNIQVNAIAPGWFPTNMSGWVLEHHKETLLSQIPMKRFGGKDDLKGAVVLLASDASAYITGHVLVVDGGQTAW